MPRRRPLLLVSCLVTCRVRALTLGLTRYIFANTSTFRLIALHVAVMVLRRCPFFTHQRPCICAPPTTHLDLFARLSGAYATKRRARV